ncbi:MAG TPA: helix-turn-helix domain-containing protein [Candidatus Nanoarchaeia archaeon]|nr:helix-turn-helix domain-containing protein [Candidatus Nanoarchaeia archaeon]
MAEHHVDALREYGLSENEIKVYIALLKRGESTAQTIAKNAGLPRTTTYHLLESLLQKGLVSFIIKETIKYFQATTPRKLVEILEDKKRLIQEALPELNAMAETIKEKPKAMLFEGSKGIKYILEDVLEEKKVIYHYGDITSLQNALPYIFPKYIAKRVERRIPIKIVCKREEQHKELLKTSRNEFREFVFVPSNYLFKSSVFIYSRKVAILNLQKEPYHGIIIEDGDFYDTQKNIFELLWKTYKKS